MFRDYYIKMILWYLTAQITAALIFRRGSINDVSIDFINAENFLKVSLYLLVNWSIYMLELTKVAGVVVNNICTFARLEEMSEFDHDLRQKLTSEKVDRQGEYIYNAIKHAHAGQNGPTMEFLYDFLYRGDFQLSRTVGPKIVQALPAIFQAAVHQELVPGYLRFSDSFGMSTIKLFGIISYSFNHNFSIVSDILSVSTSWFYNLLFSTQGLINRVFADEGDNVSLGSKTDTKKVAPAKAPSAKKPPTEAAPATKNAQKTTEESSKNTQSGTGKQKSKK